MAEANLNLHVRVRDDGTLMLEGMKGRILAVGKAGSVAGKELDDAFSRAKTSCLSLIATYQGLKIAIVAAARFIKDVVSAAADSEAALSRLSAAVNATGHASGFTTEALREMAADLSRLTAVEDETILGAQAVLSTFRQIRGDTFREATAAALDLSRLLEVDLKSAALQLGKALQNPTDGLQALRRSGISFTEAQKEQIRTMEEAGDLASAQKVILRELQAEVGGAAAAYGNSFAGALRSVAIQWGEVKEASGSFLASSPAVSTVFRGLADSLADIASWLSELSKTKAGQEWAKSFGIALLTTAEAATRSFGGLIQVFQSLQVSAASMLKLYATYRLWDAKAEAWVYRGLNKNDPALQRARDKVQAFESQKKAAEDMITAGFRGMDSIDAVLDLIQDRLDAIKGKAAFAPLTALSPSRNRSPGPKETKLGPEGEPGAPGKGKLSALDPRLTAYAALEPWRQLADKEAKATHEARLNAYNALAPHRARIARDFWVEFLRPPENAAAQFRNEVEGLLGGLRRAGQEAFSAWYNEDLGAILAGKPSTRLGLEHLPALQRHRMETAVDWQGGGFRTPRVDVTEMEALSAHRYQSDWRWEGDFNASRIDASQMSALARHRQALADQKKGWEELRESIKATSEVSAQWGDLMSGIYEQTGRDRRAWWNLYKAFATAQVVTDTASAIMATWSSYAKMGPWGVALATAQTAALAGLGALQLAQINSQNPRAHGGLDYVPETGSYVLKRGELVADPGTSRQVRENLLNASQGRAVDVTVNIVNPGSLSARDAAALEARISQTVYQSVRLGLKADPKLVRGVRQAAGA